MATPKKKTAPRRPRRPRVRKPAAAAPQAPQGRQVELSEVGCLRVVAALEKLARLRTEYQAAEAAVRQTSAQLVAEVCKDGEMLANVDLEGRKALAVPEQNPA